MDKWKKKTNVQWKVNDNGRKTFPSKITLAKKRGHLSSRWPRLPQAFEVDSGFRFGTRVRRAEVSPWDWFFCLLNIAILGGLGPVICRERVQGSNLAPKPFQQALGWLFGLLLQPKDCGVLLPSCDQPYLNSSHQERLPYQLNRYKYAQQSWS